MAFKRSAVRSRLSPPKKLAKCYKKHCFGNKTVFFHGGSTRLRFDTFADSTKRAGYPHFLRRKIQSIEELAQIKSEFDVQFIVSSDLYASDQTTHDHLFCFNAGAVIELCPGNQFVVLIGNLCT